MQVRFTNCEGLQKQLTRIGIIKGLGFCHLPLCLYYVLLELPKYLIVPTLQFILEKFELLSKDKLGSTSARDGLAVLYQGDKGVMVEPHFFKFEGAF